jgi:hypothetical protein
MSTTTLHTRDQVNRQQRALIIFAYLTLLFALSVYGFWQAVLPWAPTNLIWAQAGVLAVLLLVAQLRSLLRPLRHFILIIFLAIATTAGAV